MATVQEIEQLITAHARARAAHGIWAGDTVYTPHGRGILLEHDGLSLTAAQRRYGPEAPQWCRVHTADGIAWHTLNQLEATR